MQIKNLATTKVGTRVRVSAEVVYEDSERPTREVYIETTEQYAEGLTQNPHAFLVASIMPALRAGEQRLHIDGELCPDLREGLTAAMTWLLHWYYEPEHKRVQIEAKTMCAVPQAWRNDRAGQFFFGRDRFSGDVTRESLELSGGASGFDQGWVAGLWTGGRDGLR